MCFRVLVFLLIAAVGLPAQALPGDQGSVLDRGKEIPTVEEAFGITAAWQPEAAAIRVEFNVLESCYLYRHRMDFRLETPDGALISDFADLELPPGKTKDDEIFGEVQVYPDDITITLPLEARPGPSVLVIDYQGCLENQLCYPPANKRIRLQPAATGPAPGASTDTDGPSATRSAPAGNSGSKGPGFLSTLQSEDANAFTRWMAGHGLGMVIVLFFVGGLLLAFTPCVFPMIPILTGVIAGEDNPSAYRGFTLSLAYVLGVAVPYTLAGLLVALFGAGVNLQYWLQQPAAIIAAALVFGVLSLAMFGLYDLQLPAGLRERLHRHGHDRGGSLLGAGLLGVLSALIVSPCVTPILAGALVYVASTGDAFTGAASLFALSLGMGVPLVLVGTGGGSLLPRAGNWMEDIKHVFGVLMLGVAIWLLDRILADGITLALYGVLLAVYGVQLGALEPGGEYRLRRGIALLLTLYGALMIIGAASGGTNPWQPLGHFQDRNGTATPTPTLSTQTPQWQTLDTPGALARALDEAESADRPVLVDFFAEWCVACRVLEEETLSHPRVLEAMRGFRLLRVDITEVNEANRALMKDYQVLGLPTLMFRGPDGAEPPDSRVLGEMGPQRFLQHLRRRVFPALDGYPLTDRPGKG